MKHIPLPIILGICLSVVLCILAKIASSYGLWCVLGVFLCVAISVIMIICCSISSPEEYDPIFSSPISLEQVHDIIDASMDSDTTIGAAVYVEVKDSVSLRVAILDREPGKRIVAVWSSGLGGKLYQDDYGKTWRIWLQDVCKAERDKFDWGES